MGDYNSYLDGLMADCRRSVQHHFDPPQSPHVAPQYFATRPSPLPSHTFKEPKATVPRPHISKNLPGTAIAPVAHTLGSVPFATTAPGPYTHNYLNLPAAGPGPGPPRSPPPAATTPSPFTPLFELPIASSISACAPQKPNAPTTPVRLTEQRHDRRKDCIEEEADKEYPPRYKNMSQGPMRKELKRRGLLCHGPNADLFKRLKKDDKFQGKPRTAENYDTMNPKDIHMLCVHRCIPSHGSVTSLRDRLKAHDKRDKMMEAAVSGLRPVVVYCSGHLPTLEVKPDREMVEEKPLVPITKDEPASVTEIAGIVEETFEPVESAKALDYAETGLINGMLLYHNRRKACSTCRQRKRRCIHNEEGDEDPMRANESIEETSTPVRSAKAIDYFEPGPTSDMLLHHNRRKACSICRQSKRRCIHNEDRDEDPMRASEAVIPRPFARKAYIKDRTAPIPKKPTLAIQGVVPEYMKRPRLSPGIRASQDDKETKLDADELVGTFVTESRASDPNALASQNEPRRPARTGCMTKDRKRQEKVPIARRTQLFFQPKDEIILLQICVKLKDVIAWGNISGFWNMVQDTLQLKTGKPYKKVSRHVRILVRKRRAEQQEVEQLGEISISRVGAGCRPLLDKWIAGGNQSHRVSPNISTTPSLAEDEDDISLSNEIREQHDSDEVALEVQKRSARDAWLDTSFDTTRCKKLKPCTSDLTSSISNSYADEIGCWSLSGSSVTSESSLEDESEDGDEDEDDVNS